MKGEDIGHQDAIDAVPAIVGGQIRICMGRRGQAKRKSAFFKADQRVTKVVMQLSYKYETQGMAEMQYWSATIEYTWGPPTASVTVFEIKNIWGFSEKRSIKEVPRGEADDDPLYTPPDP